MEVNEMHHQARALQEIVDGQSGLYNWVQCLHIISSPAKTDFQISRALFSESSHCLVACMYGPCSFSGILPGRLRGLSWAAELAWVALVHTAFCSSHIGLCIPSCAFKH